MITIRPIAHHEIEAARQLLLACGWEGARMQAEPFAAIVAGSYRSIVAVDDGRVVGFARALGDGRSNGYLAMVAVDPGRRRCGIGRRLVAELMGDDPDVTWVLRARAGSEAFYAALGFAPSTVAMERVRSSSTT